MLRSSLTFGALTTLLAVHVASSACATELSGICIFVCAPGDNSGECEPATAAGANAWHTSLDDIAPPIALTKYIPTRSYAVLPYNGPLGGLHIPLGPGKYLFTALWQPVAGENFPPRLGFNFFFNNNITQPGISAIAPTWSGLGLTNFHANLFPATYSLFLQQVESPAALQYSDGQNAVTLTALLAAHSNWFAPVDRIGLHRFARDGSKDAAAIIELTVAPAARSPITPAPLPPSKEPRIVPPPFAIIGPDEGVPDERVSDEFAARPPAVQTPWETPVITPSAGTPTRGTPTNPPPEITPVAPPTTHLTRTAEISDAVGTPSPGQHATPASPPPSHTIETPTARSPRNL